MGVHLTAVACSTAWVSLGCDDGDSNAGTTEVVFAASGGKTYVFLVEISAFGDAAASLDIVDVP